jgi:hypothetical protein
MFLQLDYNKYKQNIAEEEYCYFDIPLLVSHAAPWVSVCAILMNHVHIEALTPPPTHPHLRYMMVVYGKTGLLSFLL